MRYVHRIKRVAEQGPEQQPGPELRQGELPLEDDHAALDGRAEAVEPDRDDSAIPQSCRDVGRCGGARNRRGNRKAGLGGALRSIAAGLEQPDRKVQQTGEPIFYAKGYADMMPRMQALADNRDIPAETRAPMIRALENHQRDLSARKYVADYLDAAERHMGNFAGLQSAAESPDIPIAEVSDYPDWRQEAERLAAAGEAILSDKEAYGVHLDHILIGDTRIKWALSDLREAIRRDSATLRENAVTETRERPSPVPTPEESAREAQSKVHEFRRLQSAAYHASGDERKAAQKAFDEYRARESKHYTTSGKTAATPATYKKRPDNSPPRRKRTRSAGAKPKARPTSSAGFNRPRTTQRGTSA